MKVYAVKNHEHIFDDELSVIIDEINDIIEFYHSPFKRGEVCFYRHGTRVDQNQVLIDFP